MKRTLKSSILTIFISVMLCLSFIVNASASFYVYDQVQFTAYCGYTITGRMYVDNANSKSYAVRTTSPVVYQKISIQLDIQDTVGGDTFNVLYEQRTMENITTLFGSYTHYKLALYGFGNHLVGAYDMGVWIYSQGSTDLG